MASLQNYTWLRDEVPGATDIDFIVHASHPQGDRFLVMEFKRPGQPVPRGQTILLEGLKKLGWTVVVVWGPDKDNEYVCGWDWQGKYSREALGQVVKLWWDGAKRR